MKNYHDLLANIMANGKDQFNVRTGKICKALVGAQLQYDLAEGFPAITTKKLAFNTMKGELLGFFRGYTNAADFRELGCNIWDANANQTPAWLANPYRKGEDDLGRIYGAQWTGWRDLRLVDDPKELEYLKNQGFELVDVDDHSNIHYLAYRKINQIENALTKLLTDPSDRRIIISGWNPSELDQAALPPCHMDYRFVAFDGPTKESKKVLHVVMTQRSCDLFLGIPFNIASTSLFLAIMARLANMDAGTVTIQMTNVHIYEDHYEQVQEQLTRNHYEAPQLVLGEAIKHVNVDQVSGAFTKIEPSDIYLTGYESHSAIKAPMAV